MTIQEEKHVIRQQVRKNFLRMSANERLQRSVLLFSRIEQMPEFQNARRVMAYHSLHDEPFSPPFLEKYATMKELYLPVVKGKHIVLRRYKGECSLHAGAFGIMEPSAPTLLPSESGEPLLPPQFIIVPGMAFTPQGARLGRGKGFYDRFLALPHIAAAHKTGICFNFQVYDHLPTEPHDVIMDNMIY